MFSNGDNFDPHEHLAKSEGIFGCHTGEKGCCEHLVEEAKVGTRHPTMPRAEAPQ